MDIESRQGSKGDSMAAEAAAVSDVSVDWRGRPSDPRKHGGMKAAVFVLGWYMPVSLFVCLHKR
jgi:hypothetical protein